LFYLSNHFHGNLLQNDFQEERKKEKKKKKKKNKQINISFTKKALLLAKSFYQLSQSD
jgi:hypothetical protein